MEAIINEISDLLQSHVNRDKVVALTTYVVKLVGVTTNRESLVAASARLTGARYTLRLFDDAAAIKAFINFRRGKGDGPFWDALGALACSLSVGYLQMEKVVWLLDTGVLALPREAADRARTTYRLFWSLASAVAFIRSLRALHISTMEVQSCSARKCAQARLTQASLVTTKAALDVAHSVSWLPRGWLWGGALAPAPTSAVATAAAVLALVAHYHGKRLEPAK